MESKSVLKSRTMIGLGVALIGTLKSAFGWDWGLGTAETEHAVALVLDFVGLALAAYGRTKAEAPVHVMPKKDDPQGQLPLVPVFIGLIAFLTACAGDGNHADPKKRPVPRVFCDARVFLFFVLGLFLTACAGQMAPVSTSQKGAEVGTTADISTEAPVDQRGTNERAIVIAPVIVMPPATSDSKGGGLTIEVSIGSKSDGDSKGSGKTGTEQADSKTSTTDSKPSQTQDNTGAFDAIAKAATDLLASGLNPTGQAATLAKQALEAAKGKKKEAADLLKQAQDAAKAEKETPPAPPEAAPGAPGSTGTGSGTSGT